MIRAARSAAAAAVITTAAAVLLTACGSGGSTPGQQHAAAPSSAPAGQAGGAGQGQQSTEDGGTRGPATSGPKVPDAQLTPPGGGTFPKNQKDYLAGRVPKGTDPVAVLEGGKELCERLGRVAKLDPGAAAAAVITGEITDPQPAVTHLCPQAQPVLDTAARGFADGTYTVGGKRVPGRTITPGRYHATGAATSCTWQLTGADGTSTTGTTTDVSIPAGARGFTSSSCYAWLNSGGAG